MMIFPQETYCSLTFWSNPSWWQVMIGIFSVALTFFLAIVAIYGKEKFIKVKFSYKIVDSSQTIDDKTLQVFRLKIKNTSKRVARDTFVTVTEIFDKDISQYIHRENFIHMPLQWTHLPLEKRVRNIASQEDVYVDIGLCDLFDPSLNLSTNPRVSSNELTRVLNDAIITVRIVESNGFTQELFLQFKITLAGSELEIIEQRILNRG